MTYMYDSFELPVTHKGKEFLLPARLLQHGFIHRFRITVEGEEVLFERDDEGAFRALILAENIYATKLDKELLQSIAQSLEEVLD